MLLRIGQLKLHNSPSIIWDSHKLHEYKHEGFIETYTTVNKTAQYTINQHLGNTNMYIE